MKAELVKRYKSYSEYKLKYKKEYVHFYIENDKCKKVESLTELRVTKRRFKDINDITSIIYKNRITCGKNRKSFAKVIFGSEDRKNHYLKDTYTNENEKLLDYRSENITDNISEVYGYSVIPRHHYEKQDKEYLITCMREKRYSKEYSRELAKTKTGNVNPAAKLTEELVAKIREERYLLGYTQQHLADKYNVGRGTIADIVNYRTWVLKDDLSLRTYEKDNHTIITNLHFISDNCIYDRLKEKYVLLYIPEKEVYIYLEKLPIDRLLYMEIRNKNHEFIANSDLFFPIDNSRVKFILSSFNPIKNGRAVIYKYKELLDTSEF